MPGLLGCAKWCLGGVSFIPIFDSGISLTIFRFASGKPTALVVDVGASNASITPVHDGLILKKGVVRSPLAGNFISSQLRALFSTSQPPITLTPHYLITSKTPVDAGAPPQATYRAFPTATAPRQSFRWLQEDRILTEFKESVVQVWPGPGRLSALSQNGGTNEEHAKTLPGRPFEMPDGWNQMFGVERYRVSEGLFDAKMALADPSHPAPSQSQTIPALIQSSIAQVDVDIRPHLLANVVVTGGSSLLFQFTERLNHELVALYPAPKLRVSAPGNTVERRFASWIGGSILASLGTFHQVWHSFFSPYPTSRPRYLPGSFSCTKKLACLRSWKLYKQTRWRK